VGRWNTSARDILDSIMNAHQPRKKEEPESPFDAAEQAQNPPESQDENTSAAAPAPNDQVARLQAEKNDLAQTLVRRQADFENYRKRVERDRQEESRRAVGQLLGALLPVLDAFQRGLSAHDDPAYQEYRKGLELIQRQFADALVRHGLEPIPAAGQMFDPHVHEAVERVETQEHPDGAIIDVMQDGYLFNGRVLRPSMVRVAVHPQDTTEQESSDPGQVH
jgi:molecular chaperone GrpE